VRDAQAVRREFEPLFVVGRDHLEQPLAIASHAHALERGKDGADIRPPLFIECEGGCLRPVPQPV
jgi:hypothetical protein